MMRRLESGTVLVYGSGSGSGSGSGARRLPGLRETRIVWSWSEPGVAGSGPWDQIPGTYGNRSREPGQFVGPVSEVLLALLLYRLVQKRA